MESSCHCRVYFYLKSSPGFAFFFFFFLPYTAPIFPLQSSDSSIITVRYYSRPGIHRWVTHNCDIFLQHKGVKQASGRQVRCALNPPVTLWLNTFAVRCCASLPVLLAHPPASVFIMFTSKCLSYFSIPVGYFQPENISNTCRNQY